jgi:hypothetical protein
MKTYLITIEFFGLTGAYRSQVEERARNVASATKKARKHFGNRDGSILSVVEAASVGQ